MLHLTLVIVTRWAARPEPPSQKDHPLDRIFTLIEANQLIPRLEEHLTVVKRAKSVLVRTKAEAKKASAKASCGGGTFAGPHYLRALEHIGQGLNEIRDMGVHVKDLDLGLCDFPYMRDGRVVYLCWKLGETEIQWWHEVSSSYKERQLLEGEEG